MMDDSKIAGRIKAQITRFGNRLCAGFDKPTGKFILQMLYGIQASKDVKLSNISRSLNEPIALIKTEDRLSRNMKKRDLSSTLNDKLIGEGGNRIVDGTVLALDIGDISKPEAKKMEHLALVRDGSTGEVRVKGYWLCQVVGAGVEGEELVPLYGELYSQEAPSFNSENTQIFKAVDAVVEGVGKKGIWAMDRGCDRGVILKGLLKRELKFVIRMKGDRHLVLGGDKKEVCTKAAHRCHCPYRMELVMGKEGETKKKILRLGVRRVKLPSRKEQLYLVVVKGFGKKPLMLLANLDLKPDARAVIRVLEIYLTRWKCEESYRFIKQAYNLEDIRLLTYIGLRNMVALIQVVFYFISVELGTKTKLNLLLKKIFHKAKRFYEIPDFKQYAIADGLYRILFPSKSGIHINKKEKQTTQLSFPFDSLWA